MNRRTLVAYRSTKQHDLIVYVTTCVVVMLRKQINSKWPQLRH